MLTSNKLAPALVWIAVICGFLGVFVSRNFYACAVFFAVLAFVVKSIPPLRQRGGQIGWLARGIDDPIVLHAPFMGAWIVDSGGPDFKTNRHHTMSDQLFGYDFIPESGDAWDRHVLSPCNGLVAHVENRCEDAPPTEHGHDRTHPLGNYISIETDRGYILLAHLKQGSILVHPGATVTIGEELARVGNSGDTYGAHIHIHAQDNAFSNPGIANGLAIAFIDLEARRPLLLEHGDTLKNDRESSAE